MQIVREEFGRGNEFCKKITYKTTGEKTEDLINSFRNFEQMKGRGARVISPTDLNVVTPDVHHKTHFVIVDAVGMCENDKTDSRPLERKRGNVMFTHS